MSEPAPHREVGPVTTGGSVPSDLLRQSSRRLTAAMGIVAGVFLIYLVLFLGPFREYGITWMRWLSFALIVLSVGLIFYLRRVPRSQTCIETAAIAYELLMAFAVAFMSYWNLWHYDYQRPVDTVSWTCVLILLFPFLVPMRAQKILLASLAAATLDVLALRVAFHFNGHELPPTPVIVSLAIPPFLCALVAVAPAKVMMRLGSEVKKARRLGSYELIEPLGKGGMGEVWRARHRLLRRPAAVKLIRAELLGGVDVQASQRILERFEREAQATATLESPHTVELYDFGLSSDGTFYYVMEYLEGLNLDEMVKRHGPLPSARVTHLLIQACDSLEEAHRRGLIHRDIKPANLMVGRRGRRLDFLRVLDFGLVKSHEDAEDEGGVELTQEGVLHGTPAFLAPEMVHGSQPVGPRSDLYSLGCVAYWLLTGRMVFDADTPMKMAVAHASQAPLPPSQVSEQELDPELERIVLRCLAKDPADRPDSAEALAQSLESTALQQDWTHDKARAWWSTHAPDLIRN